MTEQQIIAVLQTRVDEDGIRPFARAEQFSAAFIHNVLNGRSPLSPRLAFALGYERRVTYVRRPAPSLRSVRKTK